MPVNISVNFPRQYLRAASSVADAVVDDDSARLRFTGVGAVGAPLPLVDCLRFSTLGCVDVDTAFAFEDATFARRACALVPAGFSLSLSSSESDEESAGTRLLFARF